MLRRVGRGLEVCGAWLLFEDGIVAHALALALLAVAAHGMRFVTLWAGGLAQCAKR